MGNEIKKGVSKIFNKKQKTLMLNEGENKENKESKESAENTNRDKGNNPFSIENYGMTIEEYNASLKKALKNENRATNTEIEKNKSKVDTGDRRR